MRLAYIAAASLALTPVAGIAAPPKWAPGHKNSAAQHAPGQIKKQHKPRHQGFQQLRGDWDYIDDHARWGLKPPAPGHRYIRKDDRIYEVVRDTLAIVGAVALVDALID
ncbi:hypothetical protein K4K94_07135 [Phaeobacter inhibens]|uniref:hypothetical protein n=1 Tax=Phaeobacter inhibens TaxID=221822 RepID=UPI0021A4204F|nr:hypothetical protein [Phaeobacter inhibens]UWS05493.1 hypothetical protein K4K94_07135 [Phaeobacter inhibens]